MFSARVSAPKVRVARANYKCWRLGKQAGELYFSKQGWTVGVQGKRVRGVAEADNQERACRRARGVIRRCVVAHELCYMWSFTFAGQVTELSDAWAAWSSFYRRLKYAYPGVRVLVVPELQKRGVWHFHASIDRFVDHGSMGRLWGRGYVYVVGNKGGDLHRSCRYLSKYISKSLTVVPRGEHRYRRSRNMAIETFEGEAMDYDEAWKAMEAELGPCEPLMVNFDPEKGFFFAIVQTKGEGSSPGKESERGG